MEGVFVMVIYSLDVIKPISWLYDITPVKKGYHFVGVFLKTYLIYISIYIYVLYNTHTTYIEYMVQFW